MSNLFSSLDIKSITLKNRIGISPMCQYSCSDGMANNWHLVHLGSRAVGGAGLIISEAASISPEGRITPYDLGIWKDEQIPKLKEITDFVKSQGAVIGIQLAHAGRKASRNPEWLEPAVVSLESGGWTPFAPSAIKFADDFYEPKEMTISDIKKVISDFGAATKRAIKAGFQIVELHAAHGYLIHQFLSPLSNKRTDEYGGNFENRSRLLVEVIEEVKKYWPNELPLFVRISATDWMDDKGLQLSDSIALAKLLDEKGIDLLDVSTGGNVSDAKIPVSAGYQLPFASAIKKSGLEKMLVSTVGLMQNASQMETVLVNGDADLILIARESLRDPYFPLHAAPELHTDLAWPNQYRRAKKK